MRLRADAVQGRARFQQALAHLEKGGALLRLDFEIIVVDQQDGVGIGLMRCSQGQADIVVTQDLAPQAIAQGLAFFHDGFIDDVPAMDTAAISLHDGLDVFDVEIQKGVRLALELLELVAVLGVPDQGVAVKSHAVLLGEIDHGVRAVPLIGTVRLQDIFHLHFPFRRQAREMGGDEIGIDGIIRQLRCAHGDTKRIGAGAFQWGKAAVRGSRYVARQGGHGGERRSARDQGAPVDHARRLAWALLAEMRRAASSSAASSTRFCAAMRFNCVTSATCSNFFRSSNAVLRLSRTPSSS